MAKRAAVRCQVTPQTNPQKQEASLVAVETMRPQSPGAASYLQKVNKLWVNSPLALQGVRVQNALLFMKGGYR